MSEPKVDQQPLAEELLALPGSAVGIYEFEISTDGSLTQHALAFFQFGCKNRLRLSDKANIDSIPASFCFFRKYMYPKSPLPSVPVISKFFHVTGPFFEPGNSLLLPLGVLYFWHDILVIVGLCDCSIRGRSGLILSTYVTMERSP